MAKKDDVTAVTDDATYTQICQDIRFTDDISFKLLGLVPFLSGSGIITVLLKREMLWSEAIYVISLFGALLIFFLFRWELRNIQVCKWLIERAAEIEKNDLKNENDKAHFYRRSVAPLLLRTSFGKTEAEKWIYSITIFAWLTLPWIVWESNPNKIPVQGTEIYLTAGYAGLAVFIFIRTLSSALSKINTEPKAK